MSHQTIISGEVEQCPYKVEQNTKKTTYRRYCKKYHKTIHGYFTIEILIYSYFIITIRLITQTIVLLRK